LWYFRIAGNRKLTHYPSVGIVDEWEASQRALMNRHFRREGWIMFIVALELSLIVAIHFVRVFLVAKLKLRHYQAGITDKLFGLTI
jgi:hypothetical protein